MLMPVALTLWYMSMDLAPFLFKNEDLGNCDGRFRSGLASQCSVLRYSSISVRVHERIMRFGSICAASPLSGSGLSLMDSDSELGKFVYFCINIFLIAVGALLSRRAFAVFGGFGAAGYIGHLTWRVFSDSVVFPFVLSFAGFFVIWLGIRWQKKEKQITALLRSFLSPEMRSFLERNE